MSASGNESQIVRLVGRPWFWVALVALLFGAPLVRGLVTGEAPRPPPVLGTFPEFSLLDDRGRAVSRASLRGHATFVNLLCARCTVEGAVAAETMRELQKRTRQLGDALELVSFSADGDPDTLRTLRRAHQGGLRWSLLAGAPAGIRALVPDGGFLLVDGQSRIRGRYVGDDAIARGLRDAALVLAHP